MNLENNNILPFINISDQIISDKQISAEETLLHKQKFIDACNNDDHELVRTLINKNLIDLNSSEAKDGFFAAIDNKNIEIVSLLLENKLFGARDLENLALLYASALSNEKMVRYLLTQTKITEKERNKAFLKACEKDDKDIVALFLKDKHFDPANSQNAGIIEACEKKSINVIPLLLADPRINPADQNHAALKKVWYSHYEIPDLLLLDERMTSTFEDFLLSNLFMDKSGFFKLGDIPIFFDRSLSQLPEIPYLGNSLLKNPLIRKMLLLNLHILIHELGHVLAYKLVYKVNSRVTVGMNDLSGFTAPFPKNKIQTTPLKETLVALAGPVTHVAMSSLQVFSGALLKGTPFWPIGLASGAIGAIQITGEVAYAVLSIKSGGGDFADISRQGKLFLVAATIALFAQVYFSIMMTSAILTHE